MFIFSKTTVYDESVNTHDKMWVSEAGNNCPITTVLVDIQETGLNLLNLSPATELVCDLRWITEGHIL